MVDRRKKDLTYLAWFIAGIFIVSIFSSFFFTRFDFTREKRYTVSEITKKLLGGLEDNMQITVYLEGAFPPAFKRLHNATRDLLVDFRAYSKGKLRVDFVEPLSGNADNQEQVLRQLVSLGLEPLNLNVKTEEGSSQKIIFPAALVIYQGIQIPVNLFQNRTGATPGESEEILNNSIQNLEYAFASAIKKAAAKGKPMIGFTEGHNELTNLQLSDATASLQDGYEVVRVNLKQVTLSGLDKLKLLVIAKPDIAFTEAEKYKIDYFVMHGGRILWTLDNISAELDSLGRMGSMPAFPKKLNLDDILFKYGVRVNYNLISDMTSARIPINVGQGQMQLLPWSLYPVFIPVSRHLLVKNLNGIRSEFASTIDTIAVKGISKHIILTSSPYNRILNSMATISLQMIEQQSELGNVQNEPKVAGVLLEGIFPSDFKGRAVPDSITETAVIPARSKFTKMVVIGDGDILKNQINSRDNSPYPLGYDQYTQIQYGNKNLLLNIADYLTDDSGIMELRTKEIKMRLLDKARISKEKSAWQVLNIGLPILLIGLFGIFQHYYRKRKYAH